MGDCAACPRLPTPLLSRIARVGFAERESLAAEHPHLALLGVVCGALATEPAVQAGRDAASTLEYAGAAVGLVGRMTIALVGVFIAWEGQKRLRLAPVLGCALLLGAGWIALHLLLGVEPDQDLTFYGEDGRCGARRDLSEVRVSDGRGRALRARDVAGGRAAACPPRGDDARLPSGHRRGDLVGRNAVERVARGVRRSVAAEPVPLGASLRPRADGLPGRRARPRLAEALGACRDRPWRRRCAQVVAGTRALGSRRHGSSRGATGALLYR